MQQIYKPIVFNTKSFTEYMLRKHMLQNSCLPKDCKLDCQRLYAVAASVARVL